MTAESILDWATVIAIALLLFGLACAFTRMAMGPSNPDRIVALDMVSMLLVAFAGVAAVAFDEVALLDAGITLALMAFLATVALARYVDRQRIRQDQAAADAPDGGEPR
jgi:multicomponent Na+:H+ antiporter subunit F